MKPPNEGLCESCQHRAESVKRVSEAIASGRKGFICDPTPKAECKWHLGYGRHETKTYCRDYKPIEAEKGPGKMASETPEITQKLKKKVTK